MKRFVILTLLLSSWAYGGNSLPEIALRCGPLSPQEKTLFSSDFRWGYELPEMIQKFSEVYRSPKRLPRRAYWDANKQVLKLPYDLDRGGDIEVNEVFIQSVAQHIERAFQKKYVDAVFFPDMGHSHLLVPLQLMKEKYDRYPVGEMTEMYREIFRDSNIKVLYHTAEQLRTLDPDDKIIPDPQVQWRYRTRNIVGDNLPTSDLQVLQNPKSKANTVHEVPGYYWWGAGFNLSAQENGCFEYRAHGKVYRFDLSMFDLEPEFRGHQSQDNAL